MICSANMEQLNRSTYIFSAGDFSHEHTAKLSSFARTSSNSLLLILQLSCSILPQVILSWHVPEAKPMGQFKFRTKSEGMYACFCNARNTMPPSLSKKTRPSLEWTWRFWTAKSAVCWLIYLFPTGGWGRMRLSGGQTPQLQLRPVQCDGDHRAHHSARRAVRCDTRRKPIASEEQQIKTLWATQTNYGCPHGCARGRRKCRLYMSKPCRSNFTFFCTKDTRRCLNS